MEEVRELRSELRQLIEAVDELKAELIEKIDEIDFDTAYPGVRR